MVPSPFTFTYTWISLPSNIFTNSSPGVEFSLIMYLYIPALTASSVNPIFPLSSVLSVYLGHKSITETEYYLRLVQDEAKECQEQVKKYTKKLYESKVIYSE